MVFISFIFLELYSHCNCNCTKLLFITFHFIAKSLTRHNPAALLNKFIFLVREQVSRLTTTVATLQYVGCSIIFGEICTGDATVSYDKKIHRSLITIILISFCVPAYPRRAFDWRFIVMHNAISVSMYIRKLFCKHSLKCVQFRIVQVPRKVHLYWGRHQSCLTCFPIQQTSFIFQQHGN